MGITDTTSTRWAPLPLYKVVFEQMTEAGPIEREAWVRAQSTEHAAFKVARQANGWELLEVIRIR